MTHARGTSAQAKVERLLATVGRRSLVRYDERGILAVCRGIGLADGKNCYSIDPIAAYLSTTEQQHYVLPNPWYSRHG